MWIGMEFMTSHSTSTPTQAQPYGMTGRLAYLSGRRPKLILTLWALFFVQALGVAAGFPADLTTDIELTNNPEADRADALLDERMQFDGGPSPAEYEIGRAH